jgi:hypothetical protein
MVLDAKDELSYQYTHRNTDWEQHHMTTDTKKTFEARIWEKAEHWTFDITIRAEDEKEARTQLLRAFPRRSYTIQSIYS